MTRGLTDDAANTLLPGADHYRAFVGPPAEYDLMGATQFALLVALGLRGHHRLLDFGCGSLRAGRLLIPYLDRGNYHGLEPNGWLVDEGLQRQLGPAIAGVKWPHFHGFDDFRADRCGTGFDVILAQSIFSHAGHDLMATALAGFRAALGPHGFAALTVLHPDRTGGVEVNPPGWCYPECVSYAPDRLQQLFAGAELAGRAIPWFHPRQTWYIVARDPSRLPPASADIHLSGAILDTAEWRDSV